MDHDLWMARDQYDLKLTDRPMKSKSWSSTEIIVDFGEWKDCGNGMMRKECTPGNPI